MKSTMFEHLNNEYEREAQLMYELNDANHDYLGDPESPAVFVKRQNRQERKRRKTCKEYPGTLRFNAVRHAIEYMDGLRMRRQAPEKLISQYMRGGYALDMAE